MNARTKISTIVACCVLASRIVAAAVDEISILDYGIYEGVEKGVRQETNSPTGRLRQGPVELVKRTDTVPARLGMLFGYRFAMTDELRKQPLKFVYLFPEMTNPKTSRTFKSFEKSGFETAQVDHQGVLYHLTEPWELVPGEWTFQVFSGDLKVCEKKFTVVKAN